MKKVFATVTLLSFVPWLVVALTFLSVATPAVAATDVVCVDRTKFIERLKQSYGERPVSSGINFNGVMVEVFASQDGHFTILATRPNGVSCLIASGENWQADKLIKAEISL